MKVLVAPDSFKGSITANEASELIKKSILDIYSNFEVHTVPMADGGEGTMNVLINALNGKIHKVLVKNPLGKNIVGEYGTTPDNRTAIIEISSASGLDLLAKEELNPYLASTYGTGQLILDAIHKGISDFIICLGGSATNDGGIGILKALGFRFLDCNAKELNDEVLSLKRLNYIDTTNVDPKILNAKFRIACDVDSYFIGRNGASVVFGPQKGATPEMVEELNKSLSTFANVIQKQTGKSIHYLNGSGAAGGTAGGLSAFLNVNLESGINLVIDTLNIENLLKKHSFDVILTGEGKLDVQTTAGKVVSGLANLSKKYDTPLIALTGKIEGDLSELFNSGLTAAFSIVNGPITVENSIKNSRELIKNQTQQIFHLLTI